MKYFILGVAILLEVAGTLHLPKSQNFTVFWPTLIIFISYGLAFYLLTFAVRDFPIAVVYSVWSGLGVFLVAIMGFVLYNQSLSWQAILGLVFIVIGVLLVNFYGEAH